MVPRAPPSLRSIEKSSARSGAGETVCRKLLHECDVHTLLCRSRRLLFAEDKIMTKPVIALAHGEALHGSCFALPSFPPDVATPRLDAAVDARRAHKTSTARDVIAQPLAWSAWLREQPGTSPR